MQVPVDYQDRFVCIVGLGYVGLTLAVVMAEAGFKVTGIERNPEIVKLVNSGKAHFLETGLDARLAIQVRKGNLIAFETLADADPDVSVYILTVGTPLVNTTKRVNLDAMVSVSEEISARLKPDDLVILRSTVRIGVSRDLVKPILDKRGVPYRLAFCPERTLEGKALSELVSLPQIVGGLDDASSLRAGQLYGFLSPTIVRVSSLEAAEMIKLVNNTQRDLMFAFANEVAGYCDSVRISAPEVIQSANIGYARSALAKPGPVGGPCLEKDPYILSEGVSMVGGVAGLALLGRDINESLPSDTIAFSKTVLDKRVDASASPNVTIIGLAFKGVPETSDLRGTLAIPLIEEIRKQMPSARITGYDPACREDDLATLGIGIASDFDSAFEQADLVIFQNNNAKFGLLDLNSFSKLMREGGLIYDLWAQFDISSLELAKGVAYTGLGLRYTLSAGADA